MVEKKSYPKKPLMMKDESLSSYLIRVAYHNHCLTRDIFSSVRIKQDAPRIRWKIDWEPDSLINMRLLSEYLDVNDRQIYLGTLTPMCAKFLSGNEMDVSTFIGNSVEKINRRFCPYCISNKVAYKLIWQIKKIEICDDHKVRLMDHCQYCFNSIPYISDTLAQGKCPYCNSFLFQNKSEIVGSWDLIEDQLSQYLAWRYLLDPNSNVTFQENNNLKGKNAQGRLLAALILFVLQDKAIKLRRNEIKYSTHYVHGLVNYVKKGKVGGMAVRVTLPLIIDVTLRKKITFEQLLNLDIPNNYVKSIIREGRVKIQCLNPWCKSFKSMDSLHRVYFRAKVCLGEPYYNVHMCEDCGMMFGENINGDWCEVGDMVRVGKKVARLLIDGWDIKGISNELNISTTEVVKKTAFLSKNNVFDDEVVFKLFRRFQEDDDPISKIRVLRTMNRKVWNAKLLYGWDQFEYYYYCYDPKIQFIIHDERLKTKRKQSAKLPPKKVKRKQLDSSEILDLWKKTKEYILKCLKSKEEPGDLRFFKFLGRGRKWLRRYAPEILEWFFQQKLVLVEQLKTDMKMDRQKEMVAALIRQYGIDGCSSIKELITKNGMNERYFKLHGITETLFFVRDNLRNGTISLEWLERTFAVVGAGNWLMHKIQSKGDQFNY
ncbi:TniQ family protein [Paenibacillus antri]|uniref:TniQ family protein n=1 Tax=Paenibacillus antri TaxID=2582848 RepID=A0A5R9GAC3_9BACL|nr:TniQ family protein [Paenibacillus antri]TLS50034.1 TniQ family protein [Paenibacillus antri]